MKVRGFAITIIIMMFVSLAALFIVSALTYLFKWQADKAMIGIIVTYILTGFSGGLSIKCLKQKWSNGEKVGIGKKAVEVFVVGSVYMLLLFAVSFFIIQNPFEISKRFLMICLLLFSSCFLGRVL